jgi:hypothetical protein
MPARSTAVSDDMVWVGCYLPGCVVALCSSSETSRGRPASSPKGSTRSPPVPQALSRCPRRAASALPATWGSTAWRPTARRGRRAACTPSFRPPHRTVRPVSPSPLALTLAPLTDPGRPAATPPQPHIAHHTSSATTRSIHAPCRTPSATSPVHSAAPALASSPPRKGSSAPLERHAAGAPRRYTPYAAPRDPTYGPAPSRGAPHPRDTQERQPHQNPDPSPLLAFAPALRRPRRPSAVLISALVGRAR